MEEKELLEELRLSPVNLSYLETLSDDLGMRQHAIHGIPMLKSGYTTDDNARALVALLDFGDMFKKERANGECVKYLSFLNFMQKPNGWFHNMLLFNRQFGDEKGSADCFGRTLWASGRAANSWLVENHRTNAKKMFYKALPWVQELYDSRPVAFSIIGIAEMLKSGENKPVLLESIELLAEKMCGFFAENNVEDWNWFEDILTYDNARLSQAMFAAFQATGRKDFLKVAEKSFWFLTKQTIKGEMFEPVGQDGWFPKDGEKALFDQQPIEAASMVQTATAGFFTTSNDEYKKVALTCFNWFFGGNKLGAALYDKKTGACFDGLTPKNVNLNQGAESMVEFLIARFCIEKMKRQKI
ncbi:MAG: hypothetical protein KAS30_02320 [Candidatus Diapherotrites archaeon]|nr:hypothetical protein [Candidatus Diapherotrites archaeon]